MKKIAINGFGRIGRHVLRIISEKHPDLKVVAINDLAGTKAMAHLFKHDSVYGTYGKKVEVKDDSLVVDGNEIKVTAEKDPANLPWKKIGVDIVLECTGNFTEMEGAGKHISAGAKKVIISAPSKSKDINSFVLGVNEEKYDSKKDNVVSMASCTTNCLAPIAKVVNDNFKIVKGFMTTIHAYTNDQRVLDIDHKDLRRARAAALNIIPTSTGAAKALGQVIPELEGKLDGIALRVPTPTVSIVDLICQVEKSTTVEEVNNALKSASQGKEMQGILYFEDAPLVSSDFIANPYSSIVDSSLTMVKDNMVKIFSWYDNEYGYASRMADFAEYIGRKM